VTREGEHGNALLSRWPLGDIGHHDVSDHRFEQRGLLHVPVHWNNVKVNAIVAHFGLIHSSRLRQVQRLAEFIDATVPRGELLIVAGDFNDWAESSMRRCAPPGCTAPSCRAIRPPASTPFRRACRCSRWTASTPEACVAERPRCRAGPPGHACPTIFRCWPSSSLP
jgi:endonuclease/exonuclease/phosphatase family metal-dependent hydrolase